MTVFSDNFETSLGWTVNPSATDTATTGQWERGVPQSTTSGGIKQLATTVSGTNDLVTGRSAGTAAGDFDVDGGTTSVRSPAIVLPATGTLTLSFSYYFAHATNSSTADFFRVKVVGTTTTRSGGAGLHGQRRRGLGHPDGGHHRVQRADGPHPDRNRRRVHRESGGGGGG